MKSDLDESLLDGVGDVEFLVGGGVEVGAFVGVEDVLIDRFAETETPLSSDVDDGVYGVGLRHLLTASDRTRRTPHCSVMSPPTGLVLLLLLLLQVRYCSCAVECQICNREVNCRFESRPAVTSHQSLLSLPSLHTVLAFVAALRCRTTPPA